MAVFSKIILASATFMAALAHDGHDAFGASTTGVSDLQSIEIGQLLATSCKPVTIYTHECQVVTVQSSTTTEIMTTEAPPVPTIETTDTVTTHTMTSGIVVSSTTTTEETPEPTDDTVVSAAAGNELCMKLSAFAFGLAVLYSV